MASEADLTNLVSAERLVLGFRPLVFVGQVREGFSVKDRKTWLSFHNPSLICAVTGK